MKLRDKVWATNTKTGKTQAEPVTTVLVHHDTDRYNLRVKTAHGSAVIQTTSSHLFWDQTTKRWTKAAALGHGSSLRTPVGATATVVSGSAARNRAGWMWDLTVQGDHDYAGAGTSGKRALPGSNERWVSESGR
jgi:Pretoxin HINT domain